MADLSDLQAAQSVKIIGSASTGVEGIPVNSTANGGLHSNLRDASGNELLGRKLPTLAVPTTKSEAPTYGAGNLQFSAANTPTDVFTITGSATKVIRIQRIYFGISSTNPITFSFYLIKRSTANTGGTSTVLTNVPYDSTNSAATAIVRAYTANPTLGTSVGIVKAFSFAVPQNNPLGGASNGPINIIEFNSEGGQALVLRGTSEVLALNMNGVTLAGDKITMSIVWTEEDT